jgi:hypothetical protein
MLVWKKFMVELRVDYEKMNLFSFKNTSAEYWKLSSEKDLASDVEDGMLTPHS